MSVTATEAALTDAAASRTLVMACAGALLSLLNFTMPLPILPTISVSLGAGPAEQTWILSSISLSIASLLLISGRLADDHGRKRVFVAGLVVFLAASVGCAAAPGPAAFIAGRVLQGIGTAAVLASSLGLLAAAFPSGSARTHATGLWGAMIGGGVALGPLAGALLVAWSWRGAYFAVAVACGVLLLTAVPALRESRAASPGRVDLPGAAALGTGLVAILAGLVRGNSAGWTSATTLALLGFGAAALGAFVAFELRSAEPMFDLALLRRPALAATLLASAGTGASVIATMTYYPTFLQRALHVSAASAALVLLGWSGTSCAVALQARRVARRVAPRTQLTAGLLLVAAGLGLLLGVPVGSSWPRLLPGLVVSGIGTGLLNAGLARAAVDTVPARLAAVGSGATNLTRYMGGGIGVAVLVTALQARAQGLAHDRLMAAGLGDRADGLAALLGAGRLPAALAETPPAAHATLIRVAAESQLAGMDVALVIAITVSLLGAVAVLLLLRGPSLPDECC